jgi:hypothetical protein
MKKFFLLCLALFTALFSTAAVPQHKGNEVLPAGTLVILETTERLNSEALSVGKIVQCKVRTDVVVDGKALIRTGAAALGRIKAVNPNTFNFPESVTIEVISAQAVDGQMVALNGTEQVYQGRMPRESAVIEPGQVITATAMNNTTIKQ